MICVDIECSGLNFVKNGIWQIGAINLQTGDQFLEESRIDNEDEILSAPDKKTYSKITKVKSALDVIGKTEEQLRDKNKQSQKEMIEHFFKWVDKSSIKNFICQNPQFDLGFITVKAKKYGIKIPFHFRAFDIHSIAQTKYFEKNGRFLIEKDHSNMDLSNVLEFCGMKDERKVHNALEDAKLTAECFSRLIYGKNMLKEFTKFKIPEYLGDKK